MTPGPDVRKLLRFPALYDRSQPLIICPIDDTLISGPVNGLEEPYPKISSIAAAEPSAFLTFAGLVERRYEDFVGRRYIINLSASTTRSNYTRKVLIGSVETALSFNAAAVAVHVNLSSEHAGEMLEAAGQVVEDARRYGLPTVGILYPRGERDGRPEEFEEMKLGDPNAYGELVGHCIQVAVDLGFDLIKTQYTGSEETFRQAMACAAGVPVVIAGGPLIEEEQAIANAVSAYRAGAAGTSFARNAFGRDNPRAFVERLRQAMLEVAQA